MQAVILAGGLGTRMRPHTAALPKFLLPVAGRPFADRLLERLSHCGIEEVVLALGHFGREVRDHLGDGSRFALSLRFSDDGDHPLGTGGALVKARDRGLLEKSFLVTYGDSYLPFDYAAPLRALDADDSQDGVMSVFFNQGQWDASNVALSPDGARVLRYQKGARDRSLDHIDYGAMALQRRALDRCASGVAFGLDELQSALAREETLGALLVRERFYEIGSPRGLADLEAHLAAELPRDRADGTPRG